MILLFMPSEGQCLFDRLVSSLTGGDFCHVECILSLTQEESDEYVGVREVRISSLWGEEVKCFPSGQIPKGWTYFDLGDIETPEAVRFAMQSIGKPYGRLCALASPFVDFSGEKTCCSLLCLHILKLCTHIQMKKGSPNDLYRYLRERYDAQIA
jgi:hypothetical protein